MSSMQYLEGLETDQSAPIAKDPVAVAAQTLVPPSDKQRVAIAGVCIALGLLGGISISMKAHRFIQANSKEVQRKEMARHKTPTSKKIHRKVRDMKERYRTFELFEMIAHGTVTLGLFFGGFYSFFNRRSSAGFLATVCTAAIVYLIARLLWNGWLTMETMGIVHDAIPMGRRHADAAASALQFMTILYFVFCALWAAAFIGFYVYAISVLRRFQDFVDTQFKLYQADKINATASPA